MAEHRLLGIGCVILMLVLLTAYLVQPARSQAPPCGPRDAVEKRIWTEYGESIIGAGLSQGSIVYVTENPQTGTFTILIRRPDGTACVMLGGSGWATMDAVTPGRDL